MHWKHLICASFVTLFFLGCESDSPTGSTGLSENETTLSQDSELFGTWYMVENISVTKLYSGGSSDTTYVYDTTEYAGKYDYRSLKLAISDQGVDHWGETEREYWHTDSGVLYYDDYLDRNWREKKKYIFSDDTLIVWSGETGGKGEARTKYLQESPAGTRDPRLQGDWYRIMSIKVSYKINSSGEKTNYRFDTTHYNPNEAYGVDMYFRGEEYNPLVGSITTNWQTDFGILFSHLEQEGTASEYWREKQAYRFRGDTLVTYFDDKPVSDSTARVYFISK